MRQSLLMVPFLLLGCASPGLPTSYNVSIDTSFTDAEVADIEEGFNGWSGYGGSAPTFQFTLVLQSSMPDKTDVPWTTIVVRKVPIADIDQICEGEDLACTEVRGELAHIEADKVQLLLNTTGATIYMPSVGAARDPQTYVTAAAHEAGHAMGMRHAGRDTVMWPDAGGGASLPTCVDMERYAALRPGLPIPDECKSPMNRGRLRP